MTRTNKKLFFLIFSSLLFLNVIGVCSISVNAGIIHAPTITANHLDVSAGAFQGPNTWGSSQQIHCYVGGQDLLSFENLGQVGYDSENNQILYMAKAVFGFEAVIYSTVSPIDADPGFTAKEAKVAEYLGVLKYAYVGDPLTLYTKYKIDYYEVDFEIVNTHKYTGYFPIDIGIKDTIGFGGIVQIGKYTFEMPALAYDIMSLKVKDWYQSPIGVYDNEFIDYNQYEEGKLTIEQVTEEAANSKVMNFINKKANIGWKVGPIGSPITLQNWIAFGDTGYSVNDGVFNLNFGLRPQITETTQYNERTWAIIEWDNLDTPVISPSGMWIKAGPSTAPLQRRVAANVENRMMYWHFETEMDLYMTAQPNYVLSEEELKEPFFEQGDWVWDTTFQGEIPTLAEDTTTWDLLGGIGGIAIFILAIVVVGVVLYVYVQKKAISSAVPSQITIKS